MPHGSVSRFMTKINVQQLSKIMAAVPHVMVRERYKYFICALLIANICLFLRVRVCSPELLLLCVSAGCALRRFGILDFSGESWQPLRFVFHRSHCLS
jgi:hypothetical protein